MREHDELMREAVMRLLSADESPDLKSRVAELEAAERAIDALIRLAGLQAFKARQERKE